MKNDGGPAFPHWDGPSGKCFNGMTLRDYFAAAAIQGCSRTWFSNLPDASFVELSALAYRYADAMLAEREE